MISTILLAAALSSGNGLIGLLINIIVIGVICWLLWWLIGYVALPEPFNKIARIIIAVVAVIFLIRILLSLTGSGASL